MMAQGEHKVKKSLANWTWRQSQSGIWIEQRIISHAHKFNELLRNILKSQSRHTTSSDNMLSRYASFFDDVECIKALNKVLSFERILYAFQSSFSTSSHKLLRVSFERSSKDSVCQRFHFSGKFDTFERNRFESIFGDAVIEIGYQRGSIISMVWMSLKVAVQILQAIHYVVNLIFDIYEFIWGTEPLKLWLVTRIEPWYPVAVRYIAKKRCRLFKGAGWLSWFTVLTVQQTLDNEWIYIRAQRIKFMIRTTTTTFPDGRETVTKTKYIQFFGNVQHYVLQLWNNSLLLFQSFDSEIEADMEGMRAVGRRNAKVWTPEESSTRFKTHQNWGVSDYLSLTDIITWFWKADASFHPLRHNCKDLCSEFWDHHVRSPSGFREFWNNNVRPILTPPKCITS